ncbi:MAG TPA: hypothetical protein ENI87_13300 [bacterium]|nr:hypothetical protein [bacterium]
MNAADRGLLDSWWRHFVGTGELPRELEPVQTRLIRAVHRGELPSGDVHLKSMTFPRPKDRLRYALRALPAVHEARMLRLAAAAGILCPEVVAVHSARRFGLPHRSLLVLRTLARAVDGGDGDDERRVCDEVDVAIALLRAGILHRDLHRENFVRCRDGRLAVLDLQSASRSSRAAAARAGVRHAVAARLLRDRQGELRQRALAHMVARSLLRSGEVAAVLARCDRDAQRFFASRVRRCYTTSSEFERCVRLTGIEYRRRDRIVDGRWWPGGPELERAWRGQRVRQLERGAKPFFGAFFRKWWWLGGGAALYVPRQCSDERIEAEMGSASAAENGRSPERRLAPRIVRDVEGDREER